MYIHLIKKKHSGPTFGKLGQPETEPKSIKSKTETDSNSKYLK